MEVTTSIPHERMSERIIERRVDVPVKCSVTEKGDSEQVKDMHVPVSRGD